MGRLSLEGTRIGACEVAGGRGVELGQGSVEVERVHRGGLVVAAGRRPVIVRAVAGGGVR